MRVQDLKVMIQELALAVHMEESKVCRCLRRQYQRIAREMSYLTENEGS